jgi:peroxiredoxin
MEQIRKNTQAISLALVATLILSNVLLLIQNLKLRSQLESRSPTAVKEGEKVGPVFAKDLSGNIVSIKYDGTGQKRVLLFFSTTCPYCHKQFPYWKKILSEVDQSQYKVTALTTESDADAIRKYIHAMDCDQLEVLSIPPDAAQRYKFIMTPITLVINQNGVVERAWTGMWKDNSLASASKYFALNLAE